MIAAEMQNDIKIEQLWTVKQLVQFLGVGKSWVYNSVSSGALPHLRLGKASIRFVPSDIREYLKSMKQEPAQILYFRKDL